MPGIDNETFERMVIHCVEKGIDRMTCGTLANIYDKLDRNQEYLWDTHPAIEKVSKRDYEKLDNAYNKIGEAKDWLLDVMGAIE